MKAGPGGELARLAVRVGDALRRHDIEAVLTGGACASLHSEGHYASVDIDFVLSGRVTQAALDRAMASLGFVRHADRYVHPELPFFVEFPRGPLAIGSDVHIRPVRRRLGALTTWVLSPTDSCRDRLAAFYHWQDRQSLRAAIEIAVRRRVSISRIRRWSLDEGATREFEEFVRELRARRRPRGRNPRRSRADRPR